MTMIFFHDNLGQKLKEKLIETGKGINNYITRCNYSE